jgi:hypothetical protein
MKWYGYLICSIIIVLGLLGGIDLIRTYTANSVVVGTIQYEDVEVVDFFDCDLNGVYFSRINNSNEYEFSDVYHFVEFDGSDGGYRILVNGNPCAVNVLDVGFVYGEYSLTYYDISGAVAVQSNLRIKIMFLSGRTRVELNIANVDNSLSYFYNYILENGLKISVVKGGAV